MSPAVYDENGWIMRPDDLVAAKRPGIEGVIVDVDIFERDGEPDTVVGYLDVEWSDAGEPESLPVFKASDGTLVCFDCTLAERHYSNSMAA